MLSVIAVTMAGIAFVATKDDATMQTHARTTSGLVATPRHHAHRTRHHAKAPSSRKHKAKPRIDRGEVFVEVYNNSGIAGLAASTGATAAEAGWQVVGTDNWYGNVPASTVYYPARLKRAADMLALDLGIDRTMPAVGSMKLDRLTVILTG